MTYKDKTVCVVDNGLFVSIAQMLARSFGRVLYYTPWQSAFPTSNTLIIGDGLPGITRIKYPWNHLDEVDLWVFPDVYFSDMQTELVRQGKRVWGARRGDSLELYRSEAKDLFRKLGLSVNGYEVVRGLDALREHLKEHENVWVKVSMVRGDMETWKSVNYGLSEPRLDELEHRLGAKKNIEEFLVEDDISPAVEIGYDGFTVDGQFSQETSFFGVETKDVAYIGAVKPYAELPDAVLDVNAALAPWFKKQQYRGFFSSELRITEDGEAFLIDPCARAGSPPSEVYQDVYSNWPDIMWRGSEGVLVEPEATCKFGVEAMIHSAWADKNWQAIEFPPEVEPFVKLRNLTKIDGKFYVVPTSCGLPEIGAVIGLGDTLQEAVDHLVHNAEQVKGYYVDIKLSGIDEALEEVKNGQENYGIQFDDSVQDVSAPVPEPVSG